MPERYPSTVSKISLPGVVASNGGEAGRRRLQVGTLQMFSNLVSLTVSAGTTGTRHWWEDPELWPLRCTGFWKINISWFCDTDTIHARCWQNWWMWKFLVIFCFSTRVLYCFWWHCGLKAQMFDSRVTGLAAETASSLGRRGFFDKYCGSRIMLVVAWVVDCSLHTARFLHRWVSDSDGLQLGQNGRVYFSRSFKWQQ